MACDLTTGFSVGCNDSIGGVKAFYIENMPSDMVIATNATGEATSITNTAADMAYFKYECTAAQGAASSFNDNPTVNDQNGTSFFDQTATYVLNKMEQAKRNEIKMIARAKMTIIIEDNNGKYWLMGETNGVRLTSGEAGSGTALGDRNGYSLSFQAQEFEPMREVTSGAFPLA